MKRKQLNFLMTGTGNVHADENPFLVALAEELPGVCVFQRKKGWGTLDANYAGARRQLRAAVKAHSPTRVVVIGHSEGSIHAMRLTQEKDVDLALACTPGICTFRDIMQFQHECRPPVTRKIRAMLNSELWRAPPEVFGPRDRRAILEYLTDVGFPTTDECVTHWLSFMSYDGSKILAAAQRQKLAFVFAKHDIYAPIEISLANINKIDPSIPQKHVYAFDHMFQTKKRKVSRTAVRQIVAMTRVPTKRCSATR
jgi:pimeloyl-ACP methyl ester carboxylesterase